MGEALAQSGEKPTRVTEPANFHYVADHNGKGIAIDKIVDDDIRIDKYLHPNASYFSTRASASISL